MPPRFFADDVSRHTPLLAIALNTGRAFRRRRYFSAAR